MISTGQRPNHPPKRRRVTKQSDSDGSAHLTQQRRWSEEDDRASKGKCGVHADTTWGSPAGRYHEGARAARRHASDGPPVIGRRGYHGGWRAKLSARAPVHPPRFSI
jgi:hypothetical protein